ncbi:MAG: SPOR domain-containing protein [Prolixibacteraceae bacterium]
MHKLKFIILLFLILQSGQSAFSQAYYLVVASHKTNETATREIDKLKASGFTNAGIIFTSQANQYRVYLDHYSTKSLAEQDAKKYERKFKDAWILEDLTAQSSGEEVSNLQIIQKDLLASRKEIKMAFQEMNTLKKDLKNAMNNVSNNNEDAEKLLVNFQTKLDSLALKITAIDRQFTESANHLDLLNNNILSFSSKYVKITDTIQYAQESLNDRFDFGEPKFSFDLGLFRSEMISSVTTDLLNYFYIPDQSAANNFFGLDLGVYYHLSKKWQAGLSMNSYYYSKTFYLFPSLGIKLSKQLGTAQLKISPSLNVGTDVVLLVNGPAKGGAYYMITPGLEFEFGITKNLSLISASNFNYSLSNKNKGITTDIQHFNHKIGIRMNIKQKN